ncbi:MAG TPA: hypothetical protein DDX39_04585 [Bacteroidales bacterium]|nr:MAG: hypothetical protein A2W98_10415 [Bacteroidetes bacterium GWF2_33_38]OFY71953.1 MAG: hypothetical protein A2265_02295 [Bacteroidetes bacterium RIFOXYA12_FULL_33_9]OFY90713.1 MAG: hypothetical protein A2236_07365 [Bacteroidetes bacterium RIFOXYA2_FULL_33_7]HBF87901.1 hypothetical protein [Bacteroidales bacterium]
MYLKIKNIRLVRFFHVFQKKTSDLKKFGVFYFLPLMKGFQYWRKVITQPPRQSFDCLPSREEFIFDFDFFVNETKYITISAQKFRVSRTVWFILISRFYSFCSKQQD